MIRIPSITPSHYMKSRKSYHLTSYNAVLVKGFEDVTTTVHNDGSTLFAFLLFSLGSISSVQQC